MTDPDGPAEPDDDRVRSLLASLREDGPVPDDVADRLDARLAELAPAPARRPWPRLLAAAAAVVLVGGIGTVVVRVAGDIGEGSSSASSADSSTASPPQPLSESQSGSAAQPQSQSQPPSDAGGGRSGVPVLTRATFRAEAEAEFARPGVLPSGSAIGGRCGTVDLPAGVERVVAVLFERRPAVLAAYAVTGGSRLVRVIGCVDGTPLASTRVAVP